MYVLFPRISQYELSYYVIVYQKHVGQNLEKRTKG
jgi:hypothetical protein